MTISLYSIITISIIHYIFDFLLQSRWMAENKSTNNDALFAHVFIYALGLMLIGFLNVAHIPTVGVMWSWVFINAGCHVVTDYISSRESSKLFAKNWYGFFGVIGLDQTVHYITLFTTFAWLTN